MVDADVVRSSSSSLARWTLRPFVWDIEGLQVIMLSDSAQSPSVFERLLVGEKGSSAHHPALSKPAVPCTETLRPTTCLVGSLGAQLVAQDSCMPSSSPAPSDESLELPVSPHLTLLPLSVVAAVSVQVCCCATFTVVVNDFSNQVPVVECWFLSSTATMTPDSWQIQPPKIV